MKNFTIYILDDDRFYAELLSLHLTLEGFQVETFSNEQDCIDTIKRNPPNVLLLDHKLEHATGLEILDGIRKHLLNTTVIYISAQDHYHITLKALRLGAVDYLVKPLREAEVVAALERSLNELRLRRERHELAEQLGESNRQLERRVRELTTIYGIGKVVTSTKDQRKLFEKLMEMFFLFFDVISSLFLIELQ